VLYTHPPLGVRDYASLANPDLLDSLDLQVENYSIEDYQTPQVKKYCTEFLVSHSFPPILSFDPHDSYNAKAEHIKAYKCLRQGLSAFEFSGGHLKRLEKPLGSRDWILAQQIQREQDIIEVEGRREKLLVSKVETEDEQANEEDSKDDDDDDGIFLNLNPSL
jgi:hypothetical protein